MLERDAVMEFLDGQIEDSEMEIPDGISKDTLVQTFCKYIEEDYYEWLRDNFESFFDHGDPDWEWVKERIEHCSHMGNRIGTRVVLNKRRKCTKCEGWIGAGTMALMYYGIGIYAHYHHVACPEKNPAKLTR